jgi:prepilin-type N-terminal cleavage/methylation domain-containing protein
MRDKRRQNGFTLPELVITATVMLFLIALSFVFVHPHDYSSRERNTVRQLGIAQLSQALTRYKADNGKLPDGITDKPAIIGNADSGLDWCALFVPKYMKDIPLDPKSGYQVSVDTCLATEDAPSAYVTAYTVQKNKDGTITLDAPAAEGRQHISLTRKY